MAKLGQFLLAFAVVLPSHLLRAQCTSYQGYAPTSASTIGVHTGTSWAACGKDAPPLGAAVDLWNSGCAGIAGYQFPLLAADVAGDINVTVEYQPGNMPRPDKPDACAQFDPDLDGQGSVSGGVVQVWQNSYNGGDCSWMMPHVTLDNIIAHELGHVFGLANSDCPNTLMGPDAAVAGPSSEECNAVDYAWDQPEEDGGGDGPPPPDNLDPGGCSLAEFPCSPLIFDLNGDGIHTTSAEESPVLFDLDGDGVPHRVGWTDPVTEEGILYFDHNHNGWIDGGTELFGDATFLPGGERARNGFEALAAYDRNGDGSITPRDAVWGKLRLWVDRNHDAIMTHDENYTLGAMHVLEISVAYSETMLVDRSKNHHRQQSTFTRRIQGRDGEKVTRAVHDVYFGAKP